MQNEGGFERFGQPDRFALDVRLLPDPDGDATAPTSSVGSWGQWRLWVSGSNLPSTTSLWSLVRCSGRSM